MIYLTFLAAILLSGIAGYYSVIGLAAIFMGAFWPVIIMGGSLEFAKLVTASWLYRNWKTAPFLLRTYLVVAVALLMLITSMGIFGFLAKAHIDSTLDAGANSVELKTLNQQQKIADDRLNYLLARAKDPSTASPQLDRQIQNTQKELTEINKKRLPLLREENKLVADIGPIKYVADMFFDGDGAVDKAVRLVIFIIMLVFDPLAVLLLIAANISMRQKNEISNTIPDAKVESEPTTKVEVEKTNLTTMAEENPVSGEDDIAEKNPKVTTQPEPVVAGIVIDPASGETIAPLGVNITSIESEPQKKRGFPNRKSKIDSLYVDDAELAFRKKESE